MGKEFGTLRYNFEIDLARMVETNGGYLAGRFESKDAIFLDKEGKSTSVKGELEILLQGKFTQAAFNPKDVMLMESTFYPMPVYKEVLGTSKSTLFYKQMLESGAHEFAGALDAVASTKKSVLGGGFANVAGTATSEWTPLSITEKAARPVWVVAVEAVSMSDIAQA